MTRKRLNNFFKFAIFFLLTVFLLWFSFKDAHLDELLAGLRAANYAWVLAGVLLGIVAYFVRALRWRLLIEPLGYKPRVGAMYNAVILGYLANLLFPRFGEVARCGALAKSDKIPLNKLVGTVVVERTFDMLCLIAIVLSAFFLRIDTFGKFLRENVFRKLAEKEYFSGGLFVWLLIAAVALLAVSAWMFRKRLLKNAALQKVWKFVKGIGDGLKTFAAMKRRRRFLAYSVLLWLCYWSMSWVALFAIPATANFGPLDGLVVMVLGSFGVVAPTNGGLGAFHAITSIGMYAIYAIPETDGLLYATLTHESQMLFIIILGIVAYVQLFLFSGKKTSTMKRTTCLEQIRAKVASRDLLPNLRAAWGDKKVVFTNGCFDIVHRGHVEYLAKAAELGDLLVVGLNTDASTRRLKGASRPLQDEASRAMVLASLQAVSLVVLFDEDTPYELIKLVQPDILVKGADYRPEDIVGYDIVVARGGRVETIPFVDGYSTSSVVARMVCE